MFRKNIPLFIQGTSLKKEGHTMAKKISDNKLTIEKILEKKKLLEETINIPYYSDYFGCEIEIEEHSVEKISTIISKEYDTPLRADLTLIYEFCPIFRSKKLHEEYEVKDPVDVIELALGHNIKEINSLAKAIMKRYGFDTDKVEELKKQ